MTPAPTIRVSSLVLWLLVPTLASAQIVTAPGPGSPPAVRVIEASGADRSFFAYPEGVGGGIFVALGDVNGDGILDIVERCRNGGVRQ